MRFNLEGVSLEPETDLLGNVYRCRGGRKTCLGRKTRYWVVVACSDTTAVCLGIDGVGNITSSSNYGKYVLEGPPRDQECVGRVVDIKDFALTIKWKDKNL
jgi:hypothetical protein